MCLEIVRPVVEVEQLLSALAANINLTNKNAIDIDNHTKIQSQMCLEIV